MRVGAIKIALLPSERVVLSSPRENYQDCPLFPRRGLSALVRVGAIKIALPPSDRVVLSSPRESYQDCPLPWGEGGERSEPGEGFLDA